MRLDLTPGEGQVVKVAVAFLKSVTADAASGKWPSEDTKAILSIWAQGCGEGSQVALDSLAKKLVGR